MVRVRYRTLEERAGEPSVGTRQTLGEAVGYFAQFWRDRLCIALRKVWNAEEGRTAYLSTVSVPVELIERVDWLEPRPDDRQPASSELGEVRVKFQLGG